jgi:hypothetical protein
MLDQRGQRLRAAVGFAGRSLHSNERKTDRALWALRTWLDSWAGIGHVAVGMHRQGYDLQLLSTMSVVGEPPSTRRGWSTAR